MKQILAPLSLALLILTAKPALASNEGSWFALTSGFEHLSSGVEKDGFSVGAEGGYWYLGNLAYGALFKANVFPGSVKAYDLGGFWKWGNDAGLFGRLLLGVEFVSSAAANYSVGGGKSFYFGLGGGFLFPVAENFRLGPDVSYRHLTAGGDGDQISATLLGAFSF